MSLRTAGFALILSLGFGGTLHAQSAPSAAPGPSAASAPRFMNQDPYVGQKKLLVIADVQSGFHHDSINHAMAVVERLGRESGAYVSFLRTDSQLITKSPILGKGTRYGGRPVNAKNLDYFDAIFFLGSGEGTLSETQKAQMLAFVHDEGKGFVAGHAATIAYYDWPEYGEMIGGVMDGEFPITPTALKVEDPKFPGAAGLPRVLADQYPFLKAPYAKGKFHTIVRLDPKGLTPQQLAKRPDGDLPIVWAKTYGSGRVFVSSFGHLDATWDDPAVQKLYLEGIRWALKLTSSPTPNDQ